MKIAFSLEEDVRIEKRKNMETNINLLEKYALYLYKLIYMYVYIYIYVCVYVCVCVFVCACPYQQTMYIHTAEVFRAKG